MEVMPRVQRLIVVVNVLEFKYRATGYGIYLYDMVSPILKAYPNKFNLYTIKEELNIYIHSKVVVIDDVDTFESPDGVIVNKLARDFRIRKFQEMTGLGYDELTLKEAFYSFESAASNVSTILQHLEVSYHAYYLTFTNFIRQNMNPQDACT
ncbi:hypothetical protein PHYPSEUDO_012396 [Phytophthora pseudosyringae]|uniref:Uncharacterized protein n=1 Tax=Phytophthora pseudosyringae TaxID=221518 RepID=A0A8T1VBM8_9STRA|nr:hypothetical protein PHYPSEUDO_012396 [Phytophthora pseudosyringae]